MKKILALCISAMLMLTVLSACTPKVPPKEDKTEKKELLFLIDEGIAGKELMYAFRNDSAKLDVALDNIYEGIAPLMTKYKVSVLVYPMWHYKLEGYGGDASQGLNRISPQLKRTVDYFKVKDVDVYLELYSSGINTNQNGELGNLPYNRMRYSSPDTVKSLSMDLDVLEAIFAEYSNVAGIRFHELIGSHAHTDQNHGFKVNTDVIYETAALCKTYDRRLIWGDHMWDRVFTDSSFVWWEPVLNSVCDTLGDNLTIDFNNNSWSTSTAIGYGQTMANYRNGNKWGYSVQSWFWQEMDARTLHPVTSGPRWYDDTMFDMPAELMAAFTLETFRRGGSLVQYEPAFYFFNWGYPGARAEQNDNIGTYERDQDYSARLVLKRMTEMLLADDANAYPSMVPQDYYTDSETSLNNNLWEKKPKKYAQTTVGAIGSEIKFYDMYNSNPNQWYAMDSNRYREWVFDSSVTDAFGVDLNFRQIDDVLVVRSDGASKTATFYNHQSALLTHADNLVESNESGEFVTLTAVNLQRENTFSGDPDEIVVARQKDGKINLTAYKLEQRGDTLPKRQNFKYVEDAVQTAALAQKFGVISSESFVGLTGYRPQNGLYADNTKTLDDLLLISQAAGNIQIRGTVAGKPVDISVEFLGDITDVKSCDIDFDHIEELVILSSGNVYFLTYYREDGEFLFLQDDKLQVSIDTKKIFTRRWTSYYNML